MDRSRILVAPGVRTLPRAGWRIESGAALAFVISRPSTWLFGALGFFLRGGIVLLVVPILVLPTQVEARELLGDNLGSTGFTPAFWGLVGGAAAPSALLVIGILYALAGLELRAFDGIATDEETADELICPPADHLAETRRRRVTARVFAVQALTFIALAVCAVPLVQAINATALSEILRPSSSQSIYLRVLEGVGPQLFALVVALIVIEPISAATTREILLRASRRGSSQGRRLWLLPAFGSALKRLVRNPLRTIAISITSWLLTFGLVALGWWVIGAIWETTRSAFLTATSFSDLADDVGMVAISVALSAAFVTISLLLGFVSSLRSALGSIQALR